MAFEFKKGCYYWEYFNNTKSNKLNRLIERKCFKSQRDAVVHGTKRYKEGKWIQGDLMFVENLISHKQIADLDTKGFVKRYNKEKKEFEVLN